SKAMGWATVPPTVHRDGPYGPGMVQLWVEPDPDIDLVALSRSDDEAVRRMAVFDSVVNNAHRKIGHLLPPGDGHGYGCDHGVCGAVAYRVWAVLWLRRVCPLPPEALAALGRVDAGLRGALGARLAVLLTPEEVDATGRRVALMLKHRIHPYPPEDWPAIPWPPL